MSLKLNTREKAGVILVDACGKLTLGEGTCALRNKVRTLLSEGSRRILLNMAAVSHMDSSGLGELVASYSTVTSAGGEMKLLNLARHAHDLLEITKLCTVFESFENEDSAIRSFSVVEPAELRMRWARFMRQIERRASRAREAALPQAGWDDFEDMRPGVIEIDEYRRQV